MPDHARMTKDLPCKLVEHELVNDLGDRVGLLNLGARITRLELAMRRGPRSVILGYPSAQQYLDDPYYMGCTTGRYSNRIRNARLRIDGHDYALAANDGRHQLHGGPLGFDRRYWTIESGGNSEAVVFKLISEHGDQGYPGRLETSVSYRWTGERELHIDYAAWTDRPTHVNLTNHAYVNLDAVPVDVLEHRVRINSSRITAVDAEMIPTGEVQSIAGTPLDLRAGRRVAEVATADDAMILAAGGVDLNYVLDGGAGAAAELTSGNGDLKLSIATSCPGLQFYGGQQLGPPWRPCGGLCLEPQFFPDSPNHAGFPSTLLLPGERYTASIRYGFAEC